MFVHWYLHTGSYASEDIASLPCYRAIVSLSHKRLTHSNRTVRCLIKLLIVLLEYINFLWFIISRILSWHKYSSLYASIMLNAFRHLLCSKSCWHNRWVPLDSLPLYQFSASCHEQFTQWAWATWQHWYYFSWIITNTVANVYRIPTKLGTKMCPYTTSLYVSNFKAIMVTFTPWWKEETKPILEMPSMI